MCCLLFVACSERVVSKSASGASESTTLVISNSTLVLSVNNTALNAALVGNPRSLVVTNTGTEVLSGLNISASDLETGTSFNSTCSSLLAPLASCSITITPGSVATTSCETGSAPVPAVLSVSADNSNTVKSDILVLSYGCLYQGGYVFSIDDTTDANGSIGGKVVSITDQAPAFPNGVFWSSNGNDSTTVSLDIIPGVNEVSTAATPEPTYATFSANFLSNYGSAPLLTPDSSYSACNGNVDGSCNTVNIRSFYNNYVTHYEILGTPPYTPTAGPTNQSFYAAGLCLSSISGYSDWYLPAVCEMGADNALPESGCGTLASPVIQNIQNSLVGSGIVPLAGSYFSSTQLSTNSNYAWLHSFDNLGGSVLFVARKGTRGGVRCVRAFTF